MIQERKHRFGRKCVWKKTAVDCEVLQSVLRTAKPPGRWMFALLAAALMLQGATVAAKAAGVDRAAGKIPDHPAGWQSAKAPDKRKCRAVYRKAGVSGN